MTTTKARRNRAPRLATLADGSLACRDCGVAVHNPKHIHSLTSHGREVVAGQGLTTVIDILGEFKMARCTTCSVRRSRAMMLLDEHPRFRHYLGAKEYALDQMDMVLCVPDVLGIKWPQVAGLLGSDRDLDLFRGWVAAAAADVLWSRRYSPVVDLGANTIQCAAKRWGHVTDLQEQELRNVYVEFLRARIDVPKPVPPPPGGRNGCLVCGVGTVTVRDEERDDVWGRRYTTERHALGGPGSPTKVYGYLCPTCRAVAEEVGAIGPTLLERSLMKHLGITPNPFLGVGVRGLVGWGGLPSQPGPNNRPWEHEGDLETLAREIQSA